MAASTSLILPKGLFVDDKTEDLVEIKGRLYPSVDAALVNPERICNYNLGPSAGFTNGTNTAFSGQNIQIKIPAGAYTGRSSHMQLELTCTETGGSSSVTPLPVFYWIQYFSVSNNAETQSLNQQVFADQLYGNLHYKTTEEIVSRNGGQMNLMNLNPTTLLNPSAIAPGGSMQCVLTLETSLLTKLMPSASMKDQYLNLQLPGAAPKYTGSGTLQLTNINLRIANEKNDLEDPSALAQLNSKVYYAPFLHNTIATNSYTLTASQSLQIPLSLVNNQLNCNAMKILIRPATSTPSDQLVFYSLNGPTQSDNVANTGSIDIKSASGASIFYNQIPAFVMRSNLPVVAGVQGSTISTGPPIYSIFFGHNNGTNGFIKGTGLDGGYLVQQTDQLVITPGPSFVTGSYNITIICECMKVACVATIGQDKGIVTFPSGSDKTN